MIFFINVARWMRFIMLIWKPWYNTAKNKCLLNSPLTGRLATVIKNGRKYIYRNRITELSAYNNLVNELKFYFIMYYIYILILYYILHSIIYNLWLYSIYIENSKLHAFRGTLKVVFFLFFRNVDASF
jgi:hypothetical protein